MRNRTNNRKTAMALAGATLLSAFAVESNAGAAGEVQGVIVHEHRTQPVPGFGPLTVHVWQHANRIQIVALDERGAMVVLRSGTIGGGPPVDLVPMQGVPSARTRTIGSDGTAAIEECASTDCAQSIADRASALAAQTHFWPTPIAPVAGAKQRGSWCACVRSTATTARRSRRTPPGRGSAHTLRASGVSCPPARLPTGPWPSAALGCGSATPCSRWTGPCSIRCTVVDGPGR